MLGKNFKSYFKTTLVVMIFTAFVYLLPSPISFICEAIASVYFAKIVLKYHYKYVMATGAIILAITAAFSGLYGALLSGITIILLGLSLGLAVRLKLSFYKLLFLCSSLYLASTAAGVILVKNMSSDIFSLNYFYETVNAVLENMSQAGYAFNPEVVETLNEYLKQVVLFMMRITPAMIIIMSVLCAFVLIQIYKYVLIKSDMDIGFMVPFDRMRIGKASGIVFIVLFFLYSAAPEGMFLDLSLNVLIILGFLLFACGLSLFDWRLKARGTKKSTRRLMEIAIIPVSYMFMFIPVFAFMTFGLIDSFFNLRSRAGGKQE